MRTSGRFNPRGGLITLDGGVKVPRTIRVEAADVGEYAVELAAAYDETSGRYVAREVVVRSADGSEVTGEGLRAVPVATILREGVMGALQAAMLAQGARPPADLGKAGPTSETLTWVARVYRLALLLGDAPTQAVATALDIPRSTAGRWVTRARDRGLLTVVDPRAARTER